jgi:hypothetical protein
LRQTPRSGPELTDPLSRFQIGHVNNQRIEARTALRLIDPGNGFRIGRVGRETVNRLCRDGDEMTDSISRTASAIVSASYGNMRVVSATAAGL